MKEAAWLVDQLAQQGVTEFCIAPGSRSTPLVIAAADHPKVKTHVHYDERGLAFFGLGLSQGAKNPAALIATSGTAVGNFLPAIMEAHHSQIPLIVLTSDRPPELRDCGSNQTTDQIKIYQSFVRWQTDLPCNLSESYFRSIAAQAVFHARQNPAGPVHLNCAFREPFSFNKTQFPESKPFEFYLSRSVPDPKALTHNASKGLILIGRLTEDPRPILEMAKRLQWPVFADILSQARTQTTPEQIRHYDWILKRGGAPTPDLILHFGERLTSKKSLDWLKSQSCPYLHIGPQPHLIDAGRLLTGRIQSEASTFCPLFKAGNDPDWLSSWKAIDAEIDETVEAHFANSPFTEASIMRTLSKALPPDFSVYLGSGMPIRDADHFLFPENCRAFYCNRGLSGIDGNIATSAGLAQTTPLLSFIGDQATLHDLNSLPLLKQTRHPLLLIASNNFGSGMFNHLPVSSSPHCDKYFSASHSYTFEKAAELFGIPYYTDLEKALKTRASCLIELFTNREQNYAQQKALEVACSHALI